MIQLNKIQYKNKLFQVLMDNNQNRLILEIKHDSNYYYMYPELNDLIGITKKYFAITDIVCSENNNTNKNKKYIKIAQKVLISGLVVAIVLSIPESVKSYSLQLSQKAYSSVIEIMPDIISTPQELKEKINTKSITKDDVHNAIDENKNLTKHSATIHKFVNDINKIYPNFDWWIFYHNIKRMSISYTPEVATASGTFNPKTAELNISNELDEINFDIILRHELTHALSLININDNNKIIKINFNNYFSGYGRSIMELLTSSFNSHTGGYTDSGYEYYRFLFDPLINKIGTSEFNTILFNGDINTFVSICEPYFENSYEYIAHLDTIFTSNIDNNWLSKRNIDKDFLINFRNSTINFFVKSQYEELKSGTITYEYYINNRASYINSLHKLIDSLREEKNIDSITLSDSYKYLNNLENKIFDTETIDKIKKAYKNNKELITIFTYDNKTEEFKKLIIDSFQNNQSIEYYNDSTNKNINDFYFLIEEINNNFKLRLINKKNPEYHNIDILTYEYINDYSNVILEVPLIDYINSIPKEEILGKGWDKDDYFTMTDYSFFNVKDIMELANNKNYNNKSK